MEVEASDQAKNCTLMHFFTRGLVSWHAITKPCDSIADQTFRACFAGIMRLIKIGVLEQEDISGIVAERLSYFLIS